MSAVFCPCEGVRQRTDPCGRSNRVRAPQSGSKSLGEHPPLTPPRACILCIGLSLRPPSHHSNHPPIRSYEPVPTLPRPSLSLQHVPHSTSTYTVSHSSTFPFSPRSPILTFRQTHPCRRAGVEFARKMATLCPMFLALFGNPPPLSLSEAPHLEHRTRSLLSSYAPSSKNHQHPLLQ